MEPRRRYALKQSIVIPSRADGEGPRLGLSTLERDHVHMTRRPSAARDDKLKKAIRGNQWKKAIWDDQRELSQQAVSLRFSLIMPDARRGRPRAAPLSLVFAADCALRARIFSSRESRIGWELLKSSMSFAPGGSVAGLCPALPESPILCLVKCCGARDPAAHHRVLTEFHVFC